MEISDNADLAEIQCDNETFQAAVCQRCGAKIYPAELLNAHLDRHQVKDLYIEGELRRLQFAMARMR